MVENPDFTEIHTVKNRTNCDKNLEDEEVDSYEISPATYHTKKEALKLWMTWEFYQVLRVLPCMISGNPISNFKYEVDESAAENIGYISQCSRC
jgi:hypothetical protein